MYGGCGKQDHHIFGGCVGFWRVCLLIMVKSICKVIQHCTQENCSQQMPEEYSGNGSLSAIPSATTPILKEDGILPATNSVQLTGTSVCECCWKSQELNAISYSGDESETIQSTNLKKSQSLESGLDREGILSYGINTDDEFDQRLPLDNIDDNRLGGTVNSFVNSSTAEVCGYDDLGTNSLSQNQANVFEINADVVFNESISPIGDMKQLDIDFYESHGEELPSDDVKLDHITTSYFFSKSCSLPRQGVYKSSLACGTLGHHRSWSLGNLCDAEVKTGLSDGPGGSHSKESFHQYGETPFCHNVSQESNKIFEKRLLSEIDFGEECVPTGESNKCKETMDKQEHLVTGKEDHDFDNTYNDKNASYNFITSVNIWTGPGLDCRGCENIQGEESLAEPWHELDSEDFNVKRIKEWISQIDIHDYSAVQEVGESSDTFPKIKKNSHVISGANTSKLDVKGSGGVKAAYNYISSLTPISTSAQMSNLGLVVIPLLSAFSGLRELNLSGNTIVRITSGALPRGLHMLNMSRNNISIIEGLRELTRLRVLDLSYNRIFRIGHGLASCSSLKELYLASNKIGEVEGLHRLLKLNVLDLRFNKISTAKSLGQLAANYGSLQTINLEGNPAQKNVGDDQLKKYLHSLLPRLVYFNKRIIKTSSAKDLSSHPSRFATSRQYDRGMRSDDKHSRRGHHSASSHKVTSSANHSRVVQAVGPLPKLPRHRDQHAHHPIPGLKACPLPRASGKLFSNLQTINPMRRSRSEGSL